MENISRASRQIGWNIMDIWVMYLLLAAMVVVFSYGLLRRMRTIRRGKRDDLRFRHPIRRLRLLFCEIFLQRRVLTMNLPGICHGLLFFAFLFLTVVTLMVAMDATFGVPVFRGYFYAVFSLGSELGGVLIVIAITGFLWRRYLIQSEIMESSLIDGLILMLLLFIVLTGFLLEGIRIAVTRDEWWFLSPVGYWFSQLVSGLDDGSNEAVHRMVWWIHAIAAFAWIALIPCTRLFHLLAVPANLLFSRQEPAGQLRRPDIESLLNGDNVEETDLEFGLGTINDLTWKQRLDTVACVSCSRCDMVCPAFMTGQPLSPRQIVQGIKSFIQGTETPTYNSRAGLTAGGLAANAEIVGNAIGKDTVWYCRTCLACVSRCPAYIEHTDTLIEIRRNELAVKGRIPAGATRLLKTMNTLGNPFSPPSERRAWINSLEIPAHGLHQEGEVLYWIGCLSSFDPGQRKIAENIIQLLRRFNIDFQVLTEESCCCGDPARLLGDEMLFQSIAKQQVERLNARVFQKILVSCPHCYNVLKHEYPGFGGKYEVLHHSQYFQQLLHSRNGKGSFSAFTRITYHDPCYLGRYQGVYTSPRYLLQAMKNSQFTELKDYGENSICCGGGGGHFWMDLENGSRITDIRIDQVVNSGANMVATACPYCLYMLQDVLRSKGLEEKIKVADIATLLLKTLE